MHDRTIGGTPQRTRVTAPRRPDSGPRSTPRRVGTGARLDDSATVEEIYVRSLLRAQLRLALRLLGLVAAGAILVPLAFYLRPDLAQRTVLGLPLAWVVLGVAVYPFLFAVGWRYLRGAERNERDFADLVRRAPSEP